MMKLNDLLKKVKNEYLIVLFLFLPFFTLLIRGIGWGADSFAFYAGTCGQPVLNSLSSNFFAGFLPFLNCNFFLTSFVMFLFTSLGFFGLYLFFRNFENKYWSQRLIIYCLTLTPLFFFEFMRFENDLFGWSIAFLGLGLSSYLFSRKHYVFSILIWLLSAVISSIIWLPSIIIMLLACFLIDYDSKAKKVFLALIVISVLLYSFPYLLGSIRFENFIAEEIPLVGLIFVIHIIHFLKWIPKKVLIPATLLLGLGVLKSKYMFLATPFLLLGLIQKEKTIGLKFRGDIIPTTFFVFLLGIGWFVTGLQLEPSHQELEEIQTLIKMSEDSNIPIYNHWESGWYFIYLGYNTKYKASWPNPDWNNLDRPFFVYNKKEKMPCGAVQGLKNSYLCD
jgi:hypothetical protein